MQQQGQAVPFPTGMEIAIYRQVLFTQAHANDGSTMEMLGNVQYPSPVEVLSISGDFTVIGIRKQAGRADAITAVKVLMGSNIHSCQVAFFVHVVTVAALYGNLLDSYVSCIGRYYFTPYCRRCSG